MEQNDFLKMLETRKSKKHFMTHNSIEPLSVDAESSRIETVLGENGRNLSGYAHGGLLMAMADCAAGLAAKADGRQYVTQNISMSFISNIKEGRIFADGKVLHRGRTVVVVRVTVSDENGRLMADATLNMFCVGN